MLFKAALNPSSFLEIRDLKEKLQQTLVEISNSESSLEQNISEQCKRTTTKELSESTKVQSEHSVHWPYK